MDRHELRFRQIYVDFHTSEHIEGIGSRFAPEKFADTLVLNDGTCHRSLTNLNSSFFRL